MKKFFLLIGLLFLVFTVNSKSEFRVTPARLAYDPLSQYYGIIDAENGRMYKLYENEIDSLNSEMVEQNSIIVSSGTDIGILRSLVNTDKSFDLRFALTSDSIYIQESRYSNVFNYYTPGYSSCNYTRLSIDTATKNCYMIDALNKVVCQATFKIKEYIDNYPDRPATAVSILNIFPKETETPVDLLFYSPYLYTVTKTVAGDTSKIYQYNIKTKQTNLLTSFVDYKGITGITNDDSGNLYLCGQMSSENSGYIIKIDPAGTSEIIKLADNLDNPTDIAYVRQQNALAYTVPSKNKIAQLRLGAIMPVSLLYPYNASQNSPYFCVFMWNPVHAASVHYRIEAASDSEFKNTFFSVILDSLSIKYLLKPNSKYYWRVRAFSGDSAICPWSEVYSFSTSGTALEAPAQLSPFYAGFNFFYAHNQYRWRDVKGRDNFDLTLTTDTANIKKYLNITGIPYLSTYLEQTCFSGLYYWWRVRASARDTIKGNWSAWRKFQIKTAEPDTARCAAPADSAFVSRKPVFIWEKSEYGNMYMIYISKDENFTNPVYRFIPFVDSISTHFSAEPEKYYDTLALDVPLDTNQVYFWRIKSGWTERSYGPTSETQVFFCGDSTLSVSSKYVTLPIYPQPADNFCVINTNELGLSGNAEIDVYSGDGRKLLTINNLIIPSDGRLEIPLSELSAGTYFLRIGNGKSSYAGKFIKN